MIVFLSDPSQIIGFACHSLTHSLTHLFTHSLTHSLTLSLGHSCFVNLIIMTVACDDANSKLFEVVTVSDVDA